MMDVRVIRWSQVVYGTQLQPWRYTWLCRTLITTVKISPLHNHYWMKLPSLRTVKVITQTLTNETWKTSQFETSRLHKHHWTKPPSARTMKVITKHQITNHEGYTTIWAPTWLRRTNHERYMTIWAHIMKDTSQFGLLSWRIQQSSQVTLAMISLLMPQNETSIVHNHVGYYTNTVGQIIKDIQQFETSLLHKHHWTKSPSSKIMTVIIQIPKDESRRVHNNLGSYLAPKDESWRIHHTLGSHHDGYTGAPPGFHITVIPNKWRVTSVMRFI